MNIKPSAILTRLAPAFFLVFVGFSSPARAGDVTVFVAFPSPDEAWGRGWGAALSSTWFGVLSFEGEAARIPADSPENTMTSFTGSALLAPPLGFLTPYGGLGIGVYRQSTSRASETGVLRCFVLGAKVKAGLVVVKGEYRRIELSSEALVPMDHRFSLGAGISF